MLYLFNLVFFAEICLPIYFLLFIMIQTIYSKFHSYSHIGKRQITLLSHFSDCNNS